MRNRVFVVVCLVLFVVCLALIATGCRSTCERVCLEVATPQDCEVLCDCAAGTCGAVCRARGMNHTICERVCEVRDGE
jgi:hypothetical protein